MDSIITQFPFDYYYLKFCPPENFKTIKENLGTILLGESTRNSPYDVYNPFKKL